ncbi:sugar phosphate isomerase/epimerase [Clostridiales bacterium COT073_COT-073]|nr:sugar phosphate isomerase/epimerase [Clostridiales bacterium COT073_COT-073]
MKVSFITDEFTQDFDEIIAFALKYHLDGVELRSIEDKTIDHLEYSKLKEWKKELDINGLEVPNLSSNFFKCYVKDLDLKAELNKLERLCDIADIFECQNIRGFAFLAPKSGPVEIDELLPWFVNVKLILKKRNKRLLLEADPSVNLTNHESLANFLNEIKDRHFGAIYDPGNDLFDPQREKPFPDGYESIIKYCHHIHIKDAIYNEQGDPICVAPGKGLVDYVSILNRLKKDQYKGWLSLEPHYRKGNILTESQMQTPHGYSFSKGGYSAMVESVTTLFELLEKVGLRENIQKRGEDNAYNKKC